MRGVFTSVTINGCHALRDLGLALSRTDCAQPPEPKAVTQDVPGGDGTLDLTDGLTGRTPYANREITMELGRGLDRNRWPGAYSKVMALFHGRKVRVVFDDDPDYFYTGRATVSDYARVQTLGTLIVTVDARPYKYEVYGGLDKWRWDHLNFRTGIIRNYRALKVDGRLDLRIKGRSMEVIPVITSDSAMTVEWRGARYGLSPGNNKIYDIAISEGENVLTFVGHGTVSVDYRGGIL